VQRLTAVQARGLAEEFYKLSVKLGSYRFANWDRITVKERRAIESMEWSLLNASSDFTSMAINLALDDVGPILNRIGRVTRKMKNSVKKLERIAKVIGIGEAAVRLTGAIVSGSPSAIVSALDKAVKISS
jgi:hypothetical protein